MKMGWVRHVAHMTDKPWLENLKGKGRLEEAGIDGRIILGWM
jgi:hypothetical protein